MEFEFEFDLFISHASEDKAVFVQPLAVRLAEVGFKLWYDEFSLRLGDSLIECIDYGLANSAAGLLVLSQAFMNKPWPRRSLLALPQDNFETQRDLSRSGTCGVPEVGLSS